MNEDFKNPSEPEGGQAELDINDLSAVMSIFAKLDQPGRERLLKTVATFYGIAVPRAHEAGQGTTVPQRTWSTAAGSFSEERSMSPKEFLLQKQPKTDVEKVACLAFFLTHYRDTKFFKTLDLSKLNTEAAQPKFANAAWAVNNSAKYGYLVPGAKGQKQLSAFGEQFVLALPNREAAKAVMTKARPKRKSRKQTQAGKGVDDAQE